MNEQLPFRRTARADRGMSLLEVTVLLAALVVISAALAPTVLRGIHDARQEAARAELVALHEAIAGNDTAGTFGFIGDMGGLPDDISELVVRGAQPLFEASPTTGIGFGWNGPYLTSGGDAEDYRLDPWGNPYDIGQLGFGQIRSAGPNGLLDDADDIVYPAASVNYYGTLVVSIKAHDGDVITIDPEGCTVTLHYADAGDPRTIVDTTVPYSFTGVHRGHHAVDVSCPGAGGDAVETAIASVRGLGAQQVLEMHVVVAVAADPAADESIDADAASDASTSEQE